MSVHWFKRVIHQGEIRPELRVVQIKLRLPPSCVLDERTVPAVRGFQRLMGLPATGEIDRRTAVALGEAPWYDENDQSPPMADQTPPGGSPGVPVARRV